MERISKAAGEKWLITSMASQMASQKVYFSSKIMETKWQ